MVRSDVDGASMLRMKISGRTKRLLWVGCNSVAALVPLQAKLLHADDPESFTFKQLRSQHDQVLKEMDSEGEKGAPIDLDNPKAPLLLKKGWALAGEWAALYFDAHPAAAPKQQFTMFEGFAPSPKGVKSQFGDFLEYPTWSFAGRSTRIAHDVYVVQSVYWTINSTATFFVVARGEDGKFQALWNIKDVAEKHYPLGDELGRWAHLTRRAHYNGPLDVARIVALSPGADGHPRFLVDAYQSADGGTALAQLSVWQ